ncbi:MAG: hypothetical protein WCD12_06190 [Candidatus Binatus sp.]|jgi:hypothetical protein|uniref:hypothetical protein n=1 Tax=Candidatus Binatus sp. TaxID=2811406 RepID=UPI003C7486B6
MKFKEVLTRLTGISSPVFGVSWNPPEAEIALGEMRGIFGVHIATLAAQHGLDIEDDLASILPERGET